VELEKPKPELRVLANPGPAANAMASTPIKEALFISHL
jgi:hypothetical protein